MLPGCVPGRQVKKKPFLQGSETAWSSQKSVWIRLGGTCFILRTFLDEEKFFLCLGAAGAAPTRGRSPNGSWTPASWRSNVLKCSRSLSSSAWPPWSGDGGIGVWRGVVWQVLVADRHSFLKRVFWVKVSKEKFLKRRQGLGFFELDKGERGMHLTSDFDDRWYFWAERNKSQWGPPKSQRELL